MPNVKFEHFIAHYLKYLPNSYSNNHKSGDNKFKTEVETQFIITLEKKEIQTLINASVLSLYQVLISSWSYGLYGKLQLLVQSPLSFVDNFNKQKECFLHDSALWVCVGCSLFWRVWAYPEVLNVSSYKVKINEENSKYAGLAQENGFGSVCGGW